PAAGADATAWALYLNRLVASLTPAAMIAATKGAVPLGVLVVQGGAPVLLSQAAGRLLSSPSAIRALLLAQLRETLAMALAETPAGPWTVERLAQVRARVRY